MQKKYIIGIDNGTQSSKVVIYDLEGNVVCEGKQSLKPISLPRPGVAEHPDDDVWDSIVIASKKAMDNFKGDKSEIIGVGLCAIRYCKTYLKEDGKLAQPVISWMDERASKPYEALNPEVRYVTALSGYVTNRLTGEFSDTIANNTDDQWPTDSDTWQWSDDPKVMEKFNLNKDMLFKLQMPGSVLGYITKEASITTGIPEGIPVIATANDKAVEALGSGLIDENTVLISLGTYIGGMISGHENRKNSKSYWANFASIPYKYLYECYGIRRGMWTISWFKNLFIDEIEPKAKSLGISPEEYLSQEAEKVSAGSDGLMTILDWLAPPQKPFKKGLIIGFDGRHGRAHMYRSILEGIALTMKNNVDNMKDELNLKIKNLIISGGGSNSDLFVQIFADVFGIPATRNLINNAASLGAAINVAVGLGYYDSYEDAIKKMVKVKDVFQPNKENFNLYKRMNEEAYKNITKYTDEILKKSYPIFK
jgi:sugar (pentulose or hexulose) kinase